jgi:hypothetical protein
LKFESFGYGCGGCGCDGSKFGGGLCGSKSGGCCGRNSPSKFGFGGRKFGPNGGGPLGPLALGGKKNGTKMNIHNY